MLTTFQSAYLEATHVGIEPNWKAATEFLRSEIRGDICSVLFLHKTGAPEVLAESNPGIAQIRPYREANHAGKTASNENPYFAAASRMHVNKLDPIVTFADALLPLDYAQKTPFYQSVMAPVGMNDAVGALFYDGDKLLGKISLLRSSVKLRFGHNDAERIRSVSKYMAAGLLRSRRIRTLRMMNIVNVNSPSQVRHGAVVFDTRANALDMYGIGEEVLQAHGDHIRKIIKEFVISRCIEPNVETTVAGTAARGSLFEGETPAFQYYLEMVPMGTRGRIICYLQRSGMDVESYYRIPSNVTLTPRESDVVSFLVRGSDNATIARQMGIGIYTVKDHLKSIFQKLDVHTRAGAVALLTRGVRPTPVQDVRN